MKRFCQIVLTLLLTMIFVSANSFSVLASEGERDHAMKMEVNGYHVTLENQNEWKKGDNTIVVTLLDNMGMPVPNADVEILFAPKAGDHAEAEVESAHESEQGHNSMPGMDMGNEASHESMTDMSGTAEEIPKHEDEVTNPIDMVEMDEHGMYMAETHFESSGEHEVQVMFHVNGEMLQADFIVEIPGTNSKLVVLWGFVAVNVMLITSAGILKKQSLTVKGVR